MKVLIVLLILWINMCESSNVTYEKDIGYKLPTAVFPRNYKLDIVTHLGDDEGFRFKGRVWITLRVTTFTDNVTIHIKNLHAPDKNVKLFELRRGSTVEKIQQQMKQNVNPPDEIRIKEIRRDLKRDFMIIYSKNIMSKYRRYVLYIAFENKLSLEADGYYRASYNYKAVVRRSNISDYRSIMDWNRKKIKLIDEQSKDFSDWVALTQFEPIHARQAFPCFDQPDLKSTFDISLIHRKRYIGLSNMPVIKIENESFMPGFVRTSFERSPPMPTYLVAFIVSDYKFKESDIQSNSIFRVYTKRGAMNQVDHPIEIAPRLLNFFEDYFQIKSPLPKIDMVAVPSLKGDAMENWGINTYRENVLLVHPQYTSVAYRDESTKIIAHEMSHHYFGNLVTMKWWNDLWLNEGFATYIGSLGVKNLDDDLNFYDEESINNILEVFKSDSLKSSRSVSVEVIYPNQQIFNEIAYQKGSTILRMIHMFVGEQNFRKGVSNYLKKFQYRNAVQDDLWRAFNEQVKNQNVLPNNLTIKDIMDTWTLQPGYPIVTVERDYESGTATLSQIRYLSNRARGKNNIDYCWWVPISYTFAENPNFENTLPRDWLGCTENKTSEGKVIANLPDGKQWVIFNIQLAGFYKIKYDRKNYKLLIKELNSLNYKRIHTLNRAQLINDAFDLSWTGEQDYGIAFDIISYLKQEDEFIPWKAALDKLDTVDRLLSKSRDLYEVFRAYVRHILEQAYEKFDGLNDNYDVVVSTDSIKLKELIASWSCRFDVSDCKQKAVEMFKRWMNETDPEKNNPIPVNLRSVVYCTAMQQGDFNEWSFLTQRYTSTNIESEKKLISYKIGCANKRNLILRNLEWSLNPASGARRQDVVNTFTSVAKRIEGYQLAKDFFYAKTEDIYNRIQSNPVDLSKIIVPLSKFMDTEKDFEEFQYLVRTKPRIFAKILPGVRQALEVIEINGQWKKNNYKHFSSLLAKANSKPLDDY